MIDLKLSKLKNNTLFTLCLRIKELIAAQITTEMGIDHYYNLFTQSFNTLKDAMEKSVLSATELAQKDSLRDRMWVALRTHVKNYLRHPELEGVAKSILSEIDKYGKAVYAKSYEAETSIIQNVCTILEGAHANNLAVLHADEWLTLLKNANVEFEAALRKYNTQKTNASEIEAATHVRPDVENALRKLMTFMPMQAEISGNADLKNLIKELEVEVSRF